MNKFLALLLLVVSFGVSGCKTETEETTPSYQLPLELKHCKVYELKSEKKQDLYAIHCPNSITTTQWETGGRNKTRHSLTVIDGYEPDYGFVYENPFPKVPYEGIL